MKFSINLKPYPGAEYFTVQEHKRNFKSTQGLDPASANRSIGILLRKFYGIPPDYFVYWFHQDRIVEVFGNYIKVIVKDNPVTGVDEFIEVRIAPDSLLDLSYSFPLSTAIPADCEAIFINPRASLGVPINKVGLFSKVHFSQMMPAELLDDEVYLLSQVLRDIDDKGMDMVIRETNYKAALLYQLIDDCKHLQPIADRKSRSKTIVTAKCDPEFANRIISLGYEVEQSGSHSEPQVTIANYATHSKEMMELFTDRVMAL